jgi:hypothetical protein
MLSPCLTTTAFLPLWLIAGSRQCQYNKCIWSH